MATLFEMVQDVIRDAREKTASAQPAPMSPAPVAPTTPVVADDGPAKVAEALDFLANNLHLVVDQRTPQQKLAEYAAVHEALRKQAEGEAPAVPTAGVLQATAASTEGAPVQPSGQGQATPEKQEPTNSTTPSEKPTPASAANAMPTNLEQPPGGTEPQPENVLKQAGWGSALGGLLINPVGAGAGALATPEGKDQTTGALRGGFGGAVGGISAGVGGHLLGRALNLSPKARLALLAGTGLAGQVAGGYVGGRGTTRDAPKVASLIDQGVPPKIAALFAKQAGEEMAQASVSAGTTPQLQHVPGTQPAQMQGSEAGQLTPRQWAPADGEGGGRQLVDSNQAAIDATKGRAKEQNKGALSQVLSEPAMSSAHDNTLQQAFSSTSQAGVKISAARRLLHEWAASKPENRQKLARALDGLRKQANDGLPMGAEGGPPAPGAEEPVLPAAEAPISDEALMAAAQGVTPEELAEAQALIEAMEPQAEEPMAPEAQVQVPEGGPPVGPPTAPAQAA